MRTRGRKREEDIILLTSIAFMTGEEEEGRKNI